MKLTRRRLLSTAALLALGSTAPASTVMAVPVHSELAPDHVSAPAKWAGYGAEALRDILAGEAAAENVTVVYLHERDYKLIMAEVLYFEKGMDIHRYNRRGRLFTSIHVEWLKESTPLPANRWVQLEAVTTLKKPPRGAPRFLWIDRPYLQG